MTPPSDSLATARGVVRLLNTSAGGVLCLAGDIDAGAVADFRRRYGREPARVGAIDAGSVTSLSEPAVEFLLDHLAVAERAGRVVPLRRSAEVDRSLMRAGALPPGG